MKLFISQKLHISQDKAFSLQKKFYKTYGTTLFGLMKNYNLKPNEFLEFVHDIDLSNLKKDPDLFENIQSLPGNKIIYTNGDIDYAKRVLKALGIDNLFHNIFDIKRSNFIPKPKIKPFEDFLKQIKIKPINCVYFEDLEQNLKSASEIGITTVHINPTNSDLIKKPFIDFRFKTINQALDMINNSIKS